MAPELNGGFKVEIEGTSLYAITDENGYFEIDNVPENGEGYTVKVSKDNYLYREIHNVIVTEDVRLSPAGSPVLMWVGDFKYNGSQDNAINIIDIMLMAASYNAIIGSNLYVPDYDVNKDGSINLVDIMFVAPHFNTIPSGYPDIF